MAKKWAEVTASPGFQALAPDAQEQARQQYFRDVVTPQAPPDQLEDVRAQFDAQTGPKTAAPAAPATPAAVAPREGDALAGDKPPTGFYAVTGNDGRKTLRRERGVGETLMDVPVLGTALHTTAGLVNTGVKALSGIAGLATGGNADMVRGVQGLNVELPTGADPVTSILGMAQRGTEAAVKPIDDAVANLPDGARTVVEGAEAAVPDIANVLGARIGGAKLPKQAPVVEGAANVRGGSAVERGRALGLKFRPSDVRAADPSQKVPGLRREGLTQPNDLRRDTTLDNQAVITRNAAEELGAKKKNALEPAEFDRLREAPLATYKKTGDAVGTFKSGDELTRALNGISEQRALDPKAKRAIRAHVKQFQKTDWSGPEAMKDISALRRRATALMRSDDVAQADIGMANRAVADALEEELGRQLTARGDDALLGEFQAARTSLAKLHDVQSVTKGNQVDAHALARLAKKGVPLTGRLRTLADAADAVPSVMRHSTKATGVGNSVKAGTLYEGAKNIAKAAAQKFVPGMDVMSDRFQTKHFGREASPAELSYIEDAGKRTPKNVPPAAAPPQLGAGDVEYSPTPGVVPSRAQTLSGDLELAPEPVQNPVQLPPAPSRLTADVPPATPSGGLPFTASEPLLARLADALGLTLEPEVQAFRGTVGPDSIDWAPPSMADQMAGELQIGRPDLAEQLGLSVTTDQPNMLGAYTRDLSRPPGSAGKPRKPPK